VLLGAEDFQIRGVAINNGQRPLKIDRGLFHGAFDRQVTPEGWVGAARLVGKVAVAQAEYYFNHDGVHHKEPYDWMWNMDWRARLVRFRLPAARTTIRRMTASRARWTSRVSRAWATR